MRQTSTLFMILVGLSAAVGMVGVVNAARDERIIDDPIYESAQRLVDVGGGRRLNLLCSGSGTPVVVLDAGLGDSAKAWGLIQPVLATQTQVCAYDRAGLGFSDPARDEGTSRNAVRDLHALLDAAELPAPYVLVGHSYGGMNVKLYAETYPQDVAGLVFVDASHEDLGKGVTTLDPESQRQNDAYLDKLRECAAAEADSLVDGAPLHALCVGGAGDRYSAAISKVERGLASRPARVRAWVSEMSHVWKESADQVRAAYRKLGDIPIIVLTKHPASVAPGETQALRDAKNQLWLRLHKQIAAMSTRGAQRMVPDTGHYIQLEQPRYVIDAIREVLTLVRAGSGGR